MVIVKVIIKECMNFIVAIVKKLCAHFVLLINKKNINLSMNILLWNCQQHTIKH